MIIAQWVVVGFLGACLVGAVFLLVDVMGNFGPSRWLGEVVQGAQMWLAMLRDTYRARHPESGEIIALRYWTLHHEYAQNLTRTTPEPVLLRSCVYDLTWDGPVVHADRRPARHWHHGIHALKWRQTPFGPVAHEDRELYDWTSCGYIGGLVALWGTVVEGTRGYRAEHAMVRELWLPPQWLIAEAQRLGPLLAARYQCPVHWRRETWT